MLCHDVLHIYLLRVDLQNFMKAINRNCLKVFLVTLVDSKVTTILYPCIKKKGLANFIWLKTSFSLYPYSVVCTIYLSF